MLGRDGHSVTVLEVDTAAQPAVPLEGWEAWQRPGVAQFRQPHSINSRFRMISDQELPGLTDDLLRRMGPPLTPMGVFSILTNYADNDTWSITLFTSKNKAMRALRDTAAFHRVVAACPRQAHWLDGEPITPVLMMAGVLDRYRRFVVDGRPVITGFAAVGDAWACTNPSAGRGLAVGLLQAQELRNMARQHVNDPGVFSREYDAETERQVTPFYRTQIAADRARFAEMNALEEGLPLPPPDPVMAKLLFAAPQDADVLRGVLELAMCVALPHEVVSRPRIAAKLAELDGHPLPPDPNIIDLHRMAALLDG